MKRNNPLTLNARDFESIAIHVLADNTTSGIPIRELPKISVLEVSEKGLVLSMPSHACAVGHLLRLKLSGHGNDHAAEVIATAKVQGIESGHAEPQERVTIQLVQFDQLKWSQFLRLFENRQNEITRFFGQVKGSE